MNYVWRMVPWSPLTWGFVIVYNERVYTRLYLLGYLQGWDFFVSPQSLADCLWCVHYILVFNVYLVMKLFFLCYLCGAVFRWGEDSGLSYISQELGPLSVSEIRDDSQHQRSTMREPSQRHRRLNPRIITVQPISDHEYTTDFKPEPPGWAQSIEPWVITIN